MLQECFHETGIKNHNQTNSFIENTSKIGLKSFDHLDKPTRTAFYLYNCSKKFLAPSNGGPAQVLPALKCLYMAVSMVLAPQIEVELRLALGNTLLDHTSNFNDALDQIQKAHQLAESSLGAIKFEEKCRIIRSLIDALIRTNSHQLAQSILESITLETLQVQTPSTWNWFIHFSLMNLQLKIDNENLLHQALLDIEGLLKVIQNFSDSLNDSTNSEFGPLLTCSKILVLSFLLIILTDERKIQSIHSIIPKASDELRQALDELINNHQMNSEICIGTALFGESLLLMNSLSFSNSSSIAAGINNLLRVLGSHQQCGHEIQHLKLPGHLVYLDYEDFKLFGDFLTLLTIRQGPGSTATHLRSEIERLSQTCQQNSKTTLNEPFIQNLLMALNCFKTCLDLDSGIINQNILQAKNPQIQLIGDVVFNKKFRECVLSFTAHQIVNRLGVAKVCAFYDLKINSTPEVDLKNLMQLNKALVSGSTVPSEALEASTLAVQSLNNSVAFYLVRAIELKKSAAPAHHIRGALEKAEIYLKSQMYHEPKLECMFHLLQGEFLAEIDINSSRMHLETAYRMACDQLANKFFASLAADNLSKSFKLTGDDEISMQWSAHIQN